MLSLRPLPRGDPAWPGQWPGAEAAPVWQGGDPPVTRGPTPGGICPMPAPACPRKSTKQRSRLQWKRVSWWQERRGLSTNTGMGTLAAQHRDGGDAPPTSREDGHTEPGPHPQLAGRPSRRAGLPAGRQCVRGGREAGPRWPLGGGRGWGRAGDRLGDPGSPCRCHPIQGPGHCQMPQPLAWPHPGELLGGQQRRGGSAGRGAGGALLTHPHRAVKCRGCTAARGSGRGGRSSHRDLVRGPTHARHLLNERVPGGAGGGPRGASSGTQAGQARGLPVKLTWGGLQLRVVPASKQAHTGTHEVKTRDHVGQRPAEGTGQMAQTQTEPWAALPMPDSPERRSRGQGLGVLIHPGTPSRAASPSP